MKFLLFFMALNLQVGATVFSQVKVSLEMKRTTFGDVLKAIEQQTAYRFTYSNQVVPYQKLVSIRAKNLELKNVLDILLEGLPLKYQVMDDHLIVISERTTEPVRLNEQQLLFTLSGKVSDETGMSLPGATVSLNGPGSYQLTTGRNGEFKFLNVNAGAYVLTVSFIGFETTTSKLPVVASNTDLNIVLKGDNKTLNEVVVVGYGQQKKHDLIGAVTRVTANDIKNQPVNNVLSALQGMVPGLEITNNSGSPGAGVSVRIRGINSVTSQRGALILIDGVPGDISTVAPADVETIDVLKDAASTAIYGARGSDGVIIVKTKRGQSGQTRISVNAYHAINRPTKIAEVLSTSQYLLIRREAFRNDGVVPTITNAPDLFMDSTVNTNWGQSLYQNALTQDYQLNVSGGNTDLNYYLSGGYRHEDGILRGDWFQKRVNTRMGLDAKIFKGFTMGGGMAFTNTGSRLYNSAVAATIYYALPLLPYADANGIANLNAYNPYINPNRQLTSYNLANANQFLANAYVNYHLGNDLVFHTDLNYQYVNGKTTAFTPTTAYSTIVTNNTGTFGYSSTNTLNIEPQLTYDKAIGQHYFKILAGASIFHTRSYTTSITSATAINAIDQLNTLATGTVGTKSYSETPYNFASVFGRLNYKYHDRYLLEAVIRRDGSSRFGPDNQFGNFYAIGAGWIFSDEPWISNSTGPSFFGKIRANYGTTGNDNIGNFGYITNSNTTSNSYAGNNTIYVGNLANNSLHWESTSKFDIGADLTFLNNRINLSVDYFNNNTTGTLFPQGLSLVTGFSTITQNLDGVVNNKGIEVALNVLAVKTENFKWNSAFNISTIKNTLVSLPNLSGASIVNRYTYQVGQPISLVWGFKYLGVDQATGVAKFQDVDNNGAVTMNTVDYQVIGKSIPNFYGGWNNTFSYKKFDLGIITQFVSGVSKGYNIYATTGATFNLPVSVLNRWQKAGDITDVPRAATVGTTAYNSNSQITSSDFAYSDASYIRIKNITLGYTLNQLKNWHISSLRIYLTAYDQFTITGFKGDDPENVNNVVPVTKLFTAGLNITL